MYEVIWGNIYIACPVYFWKPRQNLPVGSVQLHVGNALSDADMRPDSKGNMVLGIGAFDIKPIGVCEDRWIVIAGAEIHQNLLTGTDLLLTNLGVFGRGASHIHDR